MPKLIYRYQFAEATPMEEVELTLLMADFGVESLFGEVQMRLDAGHAFDAARRACVIDATTRVGRAFNKLFAGYLRREFGADAFTVERLDARPTAPAA